MKIYESKLAQIPGHICWTFCFYLLIALFMGFLFYVTGGTEFGWSTFSIIAAMWLGQSWRFRRMVYKVNDDALVQYDFQSRTIHINEIVSVRVLKRTCWFSFHTPYNMVIQTMDKQKYFIAPKEYHQLAEILKKENPEIEFVE